MKKRILVGFVFSLFSTVSIFAQTNAPSPTPTRQRIVTSNPTPFPTAQPTQTPSKVVVITNNLPVSNPTPRPTPFPTPTPVTQTTNSIQTITPNILSTPLRFNEIKSKIAEAKREMAARPIPTALTDSFLITDVIRIAFYDYDTKKIDYLVMTKDAFLTRDARYSISTTFLKTVNVRIIRANGVNTPVSITSQNNVPYLPLLVQYPVVRNGRFIETAYYISTHPGIVTPEVINTGKFYMRNTLDAARETLRERGVFIAPLVTDIAERLAIVEHIDHQRFLTENQGMLFNEVYALYALNEGQTYRYAVSSAGAGGMVQMIPSTYRMVRSRYYNVPLIPDFVVGMQNHQNAAQAMLLYMQMTWNDLISNPVISDAIQNKIATPAELMAAGYNSNPAKLPGYIKRGGANWRLLIPRETQLYLQVNVSMDRFVPILIPRSK
ncbi:hypothetical protein BH10ACI1_BH10ACI1_35850 [soil metagenome]